MFSLNDNCANVIPKFNCYSESATLGPRWTRWLTSFELFRQLLHLAGPDVQEVFSTLTETGEAWSLALYLLTLLRLLIRSPTPYYCQNWIVLAFWMILQRIHVNSLSVIFQKRVRVFHRGFQTRENWWKHSAYGSCFYCFRVFGNPEETRSTSFWNSFSNMHHEPRTMKNVSLVWHHNAEYKLLFLVLF